VRTTLDIDDDVLRAARELARRGKSSVGAVISALARRALVAPAEGPRARQPAALYGFRPLAKRGGIVTNALVDKLREDDAY